MIIMRLSTLGRPWQNQHTHSKHTASNFRLLVILFDYVYHCCHCVDELVIAFSSFSPFVVVVCLVICHAYCRLLASPLFIYMSLSFVSLFLRFLSGARPRLLFMLVIVAFACSWCLCVTSYCLYVQVALSFSFVCVFPRICQQICNDI